MVSHSSSASLSSLSFSRTSHTSTSSSQSSPDSSPDQSSSSHNSLAAAQNQSTAVHRTSTSSSTIIPFSWEEKPGVPKKEIMQTSGCIHKHHLDEHSRTPPQLPQHDVVELDARASFTGSENLQPSNEHSRPSHVIQRPKTACTGEGIPRIRPPPCLTHPEVHANTVEGGQVRHTASEMYNPAATAVGSKFMASLSLHKRRHHRSAPSLEDDPFWLAMVACTDDADKVHRKGSKAFISREISKTDSWLARRVQESIDFDQCMPRQALENRINVSRKERSSREQEKAMDRTRYDEEALSSIKCSSRKLHLTHTHSVHHCDVDADTTMHSARLASKAFKAVSTARAELHGRCKALLQQKNPPVVDISCSSRRPKSKHGSVVPKQKLPDLFGCKSNNPLIHSSRFS